MLKRKEAATCAVQLMKKAKTCGRRNRWLGWLKVAVTILLLVKLCVVICNVLFWFAIRLIIADELYHMNKEPTGPGRPPEIIEAFSLPVNSDEPILSQYEYMGWVNVTITGTIELGDGLYHDVLQLCSAQGICERYRGLYIDGEYAFHLRSRPDAFSHDGYEFLFHHDSDEPSPISFQLLSEDYPQATGALDVEVFYPWYSFNRGGGR